MPERGSAPRSAAARNRGLPESPLRDGAKLHNERRKAAGEGAFLADSPVDLETTQERQSVKVPQKPYVYHNA